MTQQGMSVHLVGEISRHCQRVIDDEAARLVRRHPELAPSDRAEVDRTLSRLADRLLLDALRRGTGRSRLIEALFVPDAQSSFKEGAS